MSAFHLLLLVSVFLVAANSQDFCGDTWRCSDKRQVCVGGMCRNRHSFGARLLAVELPVECSISRPCPASKPHCVAHQCIGRYAPLELASYEVEPPAYSRCYPPCGFEEFCNPKGYCEMGAPRPVDY